LCNQATQIWETQNQWAIRQLSTIYTEISRQMSAEAFDESMRATYANWASGFGITEPCDKDVQTIAASGSVTRSSWDTFNRCLQGSIDARRAAVETFAREHQTLAQEAMIGTFNTTLGDASRDYLLAVAQSAGLRACRP
jgi:hypothetical protein